MGRGYQEKVVQALFEDKIYAEMMLEVAGPEVFTFTHLKALVSTMFNYRLKYRDFPTIDIVLLQLKDEFEQDPAMLSLTSDFVGRMKGTPLGGDRHFIQESSLDFCKSQRLIQALGQMLEQVEGKRYEDVAGTLRAALDKGAPKDHGHEYAEEIDSRVAKSVREPISTGWPVLDNYLGGGWERKTLVTFIAPTGAGKSMFLVNAACALVAQGMNVLYVTLEMADFKIGLRADSWYSGYAIDDVAKQKEKVRAAIEEKAKGRLIIKEWPTKRASVETIRGHIQRLKQTKNFTPDAIVIDYPDLLRSGRAYGEKRHELEGNYEELRGLGQEENCVIIAADQTNRGGLDLELVTISAIAEAYSKATVCDGIFTVSRTPEDKQNGTGRLYIAKSRFGKDGVVLPFRLDTGKNVRVEIFDHNDDPITQMMQVNGQENLKKHMAKTMAGLPERFKSGSTDVG